jgi:hypothetical protein
LPQWSLQLRSRSSQSTRQQAASAWANPVSIATIGAAMTEVSGASVAYFAIATIVGGATAM